MDSPLLAQIGFGFLIGYIAALTLVALGAWWVLALDRSEPAPKKIGPR